MDLDKQNKNLLQKGLSVLSLFDGISCGMLALKRAGIPVKRYVPYEIAQIVSDITKERIDKLAENIWGSGFTTKEKLQQWRDFYKDEISEEAIRHFNQIIEELN